MIYLQVLETFLCWAGSGADADSAGSPDTGGLLQIKVKKIVLKVILIVLILMVDIVIVMIVWIVMIVIVLILLVVIGILVIVIIMLIGLWTFLIMLLLADPGKARAVAYKDRRQ